MNDETQAPASLNLVKEFVAPIENEAGLGRFGKEKIFCICLEKNPGPSSP
jgi:hypothetical protein